MSPTPLHALPVLSSSLEDYLETIFELARDGGVARVRDIAKRRKVRPASVSTALQRLAEAGLVRYERRELITLTAQGEIRARGIYAKHRLLTHFFGRILGVDSTQAEADACAMEHSLSERTMDELTRFVEFVRSCPEGEALLDRFQHCSVIRPDEVDATCVCGQAELALSRRTSTAQSLTTAPLHMPLAVVQVHGAAKERRQLLGLGLLPGVPLELLERGKETLTIRIEGFELTLASTLAAHVAVEN